MMVLGLNGEVIQNYLWKNNGYKMTRIKPLSITELNKEFQKKINDAKSRMGYTPNDGLTMARVPGLIEGLNKLAFSIYGEDGYVPNEIKYLISIMSSIKSGSNYCSAHTVHGARKLGIDKNKIENIKNFKMSKLFSDKERAVLNIVEEANQVPINVSDKVFNELKVHYNDNQICEIISVISLFGFLNKWNAIMQTEIEIIPKKIFEEYEIKE